MKVVISLTKNVSAPLGITTAASAIYARIKKKNTRFWSFFILCAVNKNFNNFKQRNE